MPQPALGGKGEIEKDSGDATASYEKRFQALGADIRYVSDVLIVAHRCVVQVPFNLPDNEHGQEHAWSCSAGERARGRGVRAGCFGDRPSHVKALISGNTQANAYLRKLGRAILSIVATRQAT